MYKYAREIINRPVADRQASAQQLLIRFHSFVTLYFTTFLWYWAGDNGISSTLYGSSYTIDEVV